MEKTAKAAAAELEAAREDDSSSPDEAENGDSELKRELAEVQDAWKSEKKELRSQVQGLLNGLESLLEESRQRPSA